jgi:hypothetical protein
MRSRKIMRGLKQGLSEAERYAVADHVIGQLEDRGDPWRLNDEAPTGQAAVNMKRQDGGLFSPAPPTPRLPS